MEPISQKLTCDRYAIYIRSCFVENMFQGIDLPIVQLIMLVYISLYENLIVVGLVASGSTIFIK